tara:strand:+ start:35037 stop:36083 length:1047 start_codon:yes stop_codon:yes gene_type:complete
MDLRKEAYQQNYEQFRSLNQIMWQIPVLAMTLTGGLWFGVSTISQEPILVTMLLLTAIVGNITLWRVLIRFRHVMGCYLDWFKRVDPDGYVDANAGSAEDTLFNRLCNGDRAVSRLFSFMLLWATLVSFIIFVGYWMDRMGVFGLESETASVEFYEKHAAALADDYEAINFESAYPYLAQIIAKAPRPMKILDVGAGTGRDAAWFANLDHLVVAIDPSPSMLSLAEKLHSHSNITWIKDQLPELESQRSNEATFDVILLNAVWMHIAPQERAESLARIKKLLKPGGFAFVSLRLGPARADRGMYEISGPSFVLDAKATGFKVTPRGEIEDLLGRPEVSWSSYELQLEV